MANLQKTNLSRPVVSHHVKVLKDANMIEVVKEGTKNYYFINVMKSDIQGYKAI
ncbi:MULTISPECIES: helix-turn-helix transcriptional regulator [unclassified Paenibacillus]|uniref:ArsR/SmtB family transcription factor n=1 Tax=unclassified Paenibacillus TaxID=185978 RepID=UPI0024BA5D9B|nr:helix-turn-helix domain-containing protein [Paenibacillus sp. RC334]